MDSSYSSCISLSSSSSRRLLSPAAPPSPYSDTPSCVEYAFPKLLSMVFCFLVIAALFYLAFGGQAFEEGDDEEEGPDLHGTKKSAPKGLDPAVLASLPVTPYADVAESAMVGSECAVCLAEFGGGEAVRLMVGCGHGFHVGCIDPWLAGHATCPVCRSDLAAPSHVIVAGV
ncbi:RING-H2 finger protein ATL80-like [Musa acuminata AAA Group]|uniref:RING-H2 finger protein ATL80-like n=1 Tax=Musa acuminata AAA Group TaxID=214697 RepID=UPI0031D6F52B